MKLMTLVDLQEIIKDLHSKNMIEVIEASNRFNAYNTLVAFSVLQSAYELYEKIQFTCCVEKSQLTINYNNLCLAIIQLHNKLITQK